jgi:hypothetical protein
VLRPVIAMIVAVPLALVPLAAATVALLTRLCTAVVDGVLAEAAYSENLRVPCARATRPVPA